MTSYNAGQTYNGDPLVDRALSNLNTANADYNQAALAPQPPATTGQYQGYGNGKHQVQLADGSLLYGDFDSNGAVQVGDRVTVQQARGATPRFKVMPR
ncbi:MAG: hypothetical protein KME27_10535 [Lyngbya sp. HA4199-MV5]|jgi:hypothetical protein|nr:hypothetical protein [Lyngbya sp. HA4199-MV5]